MLVQDAEAVVVAVVVLSAPRLVPQPASDDCGCSPDCEGATFAAVSAAGPFRFLVGNDEGGGGLGLKEGPSRAERSHVRS